ncbi:HAMP domain-containing sensor histidine kinase [Streptomyces sp. NPDC048637]|uniref:sensor histidine kinase n=1 Tax=Streptomyces sp. NPDC048637 TaxID=3155636 RepID=UPI00342BE499
MTTDGERLPARARIRAAATAAATAGAVVVAGALLLRDAELDALARPAPRLDQAPTDLGPALEVTVALGAPLAGLVVALVAWATAGVRSGDRTGGAAPGNGPGEGEGTDGEQRPQEGRVQTRDVGAEAVCGGVSGSDQRRMAGARRPRMRSALAAGVTTALLLFLHGLWLEDFYWSRPDPAATVALSWSLRFAAPSTALLVGSATWLAGVPYRRRLPLRAHSAIVAGIASAVVVFGGLLWLWNTNRNYTDLSVDSALSWGMIMGAPLAGVLIAAVAWASAGRALRPVEAIRRQLEDITARSLNRRVPVPASGDEITRLAITTNATLDRLHSAAERQQRFIADASHELRSPITNLRTALESAVAHPQNVDWPAVVRDTLADVERLQHLTDDLLLLTSLVSTGRAQGPLMDVSSLAHDLVEEIRHLRRGRGLYFTCTAPQTALVRGSTLQLERLLRNLLDNACRHARTCVQVTVYVPPAGPSQSTAGPPRLTLEVRDDGPGIPAADREWVFQRFTRLDDARSRDAGGTGLGLAIAREIAVRHGGTLHVADSPRGARLLAELPSELSE